MCSRSHNSHTCQFFFCTTLLLTDCGLGKLIIQTTRYWFQVNRVGLLGHRHRLLQQLDFIFLQTWRPNTTMCHLLGAVVESMQSLMVSSSLIRLFVELSSGTRNSNHSNLTDADNTAESGQGVKLVIYIYRKVYSILMLQLLLTVGMIALFVYNESTKKFTTEHPGLFVAALVMNIIFIIALACCEGLRRKTPTNFICLGLFTLSEGFLLGVAASTYKYVGLEFV